METKRFPFTKAEVDYLVDEQKFIKEIPKSVPHGNYLMMRTQVFRKANDKLVAIKGVYVMSRVAVPIPGVPGAIPSVSLEWAGRRIRGIDKETRHDNPDGTSVYGWHSHVWSPECEDSCVVTTPEPKHKDMRGIFKTGLKKWNIAIVEEQMEVVK